MSDPVPLWNFANQTMDLSLPVFAVTSELLPQDISDKWRSQGGNETNVQVQIDTSELAENS